MVSLLKPYHLFLRKSQQQQQRPTSTSSQTSQQAELSSSDGNNTSNNATAIAAATAAVSIEFDAELFLNFVKDDVRPFLRHLLRTKAFEVFIKCEEDSSSSNYSGSSNSVYAHSGHSTVPARSRFETHPSNSAFSTNTGGTTAHNSNDPNSSGGGYAYNQSQQQLMQGFESYNSPARLSTSSSSYGGNFNSARQSRYNSPVPPLSCVSNATNSSTGNAVNSGPSSTANSNSGTRAEGFNMANYGSNGTNGSGSNSASSITAAIPARQALALSSDVLVLAETMSQLSEPGSTSSTANTNTSGAATQQRRAERHASSARLVDELLYQQQQQQQQQHRTSLYLQQHRGSMLVHTTGGSTRHIMMTADGREVLTSSNSNTMQQQQPVYIQRAPAYPYRSLFEAQIRVRMQAKLELFNRVYQVNEGRISVWVMTYFSHSEHLAPRTAASGANNSASNSPHSAAASPAVGVNSSATAAAAASAVTFSPGSARKTSLLRASLGSSAKGGRAPKVKRRWCILDATKLSYYRSRSKTRVKGYIPFEPASVTLVTPPFVVHAGHLTTEHDCVALVWAQEPQSLQQQQQQQQSSQQQQQQQGENGTLVIRAEEMNVHRELVRALKAKLTPREHWSKMKALYGTNSNYNNNINKQH
jgi:hypothetical protein